MTQADHADRYKTVRLAQTDGVMEMTIHTDGGEARWRITEQGHHNELGLAFADVARDPEIKVVLLTGTGRNFIAVRDLDDKAPETNLHSLWDRMQREGLWMLESFLSIPVPVICAVNGPALIHSEIPVMS